MIRICALNESESSRDSENEAQVETREAQEANLLNLYTAALKSIAASNISSAKENLEEIISSPIFQEEKEDALARSLRYNVHKNLGECLLSEGSVEAAQQEMLKAADIDSGDITLWFKIAGTCVKLNNLYMCRSALEQGLLCSPQHLPSIDNLITVTFKLGDNLACLGYCAMLLELDPSSEKVVLYKSKVYNEMPFLQEAYDDKDFVCIKTEIETFTAEPPTEPKREMLELNLKELSVVSLAEGLFKLNSKCDEEDKGLNPIETANTVARFLETKRRAEDAKIKVSVQNLVDDIIDIIEEEEEIVGFVDTLLDDLLCDMFGVEPKTMGEQISAQVVDELLSVVFETSSGPPPPTKKKSVIIDAKPRERKRAANNPMDEIPEELIEKRRSSRKSRIAEVSAATSAAASQNSDVSNDQINIKTPKEFLESLLPDSLKLCKDKPKGGSTLGARDPGHTSESNRPVKNLFSEENVARAWFTEEEERREVERFLRENSGKTIWHLMRAFLDFIYRLDVRLLWPKSLAGPTGQIYEAWRSHLADPLESAEEKFSREFLRYYIVGSECIIGKLLEAEEEEKEQEEVAYQIPEHLRQRLSQDLDELDYVRHGLPVDLQLRIHSLRFYLFYLIDNEDDVMYESAQITHLYEEHPDLVVINSIPQYAVTSPKYLKEYSSGVSMNRELEELNQYYEKERYEEIVALLLKNLESATVTPGKETSRTPNRETQIDILIESLFHVKLFVKCIKWSTVGLCATFDSIVADPESEEKRKPSASDWKVIDSYLSTILSCLDNTDSCDFADSSFDTGSQLARVLVRILCIQVEEPGGSSADLDCDQSLPWILLHKLIAWAETFVVVDLNQSIDPDEMKGSLSLLCAAHDYLGPKSCCTTADGRLLSYIMDVFLPILLCEADSKPTYADQIKSNLDQVIYCLFAHPSKKSRVRHLVDHGVIQVPLTWEHAVKLYKYIKPDTIPDHDDAKILSISFDADSFMRRVIPLIPDSVDVDKRRSVASQYVQGKKDRLKVKNLKRLPSAMNDIFYLLADYSFKNSKDLDRAIDFYTLDISFNPDRYDSWAALALAQASKIDQRLNSCKKLVPTKMLEHSKAVETCFKKCLEMNDGNSNLWIEYGNFSYNVHSYISRTLQNNSEDMGLELFEVLENKKESLLKTAYENYKQTLRIFEKDGIDDNDVDERWLIHYMIGKIKEKTNLSILESLDSYITSMNCLASNGAVLPRKVNYNSPQSLALETLEIYYRIHATILKYLVNAGNKLDVKVRSQLFETMKTVQLNKVYNTNPQEDHTVRFSRKRKQGMDIHPAEPAAKVARQEESSTSIMRDVIEVMDNMIDEVESDASMFEVDQLTRLALCGLEDVAFHFFHHFKALYRLAHYFFTSDKVKNLYKVQKLLLAGANEKNVLCPGLFFGRKPNQIFNDIWRIPISEIDRPGSFAFHCSKSLMLLIDVLRSIPDLNILTDIALQLRKPPSEENKFVHENDRLEVGTMANTYLFNSIKDKVANATVERERSRPTVMLEIYRLYQKIAKQWPNKEKEVISHMKDLYAKVKGRVADRDKITNEEVLKFCSLEVGRQRTSHTSRVQVTATLPSSTAATQPPPVFTAAAKMTTVTVPPPNQIEATAALLKAASTDLEKILQFQEMAALSIPNMTHQQIAAVYEFDFNNGPRMVNGLFQMLKKLSQAQLRMLKCDTTKLTIVTQFAYRVGLMPKFVNDYVTSIQHIINGTKLPEPSAVPGLLKKSAGLAPNSGSQKTVTVKPTQFKQTTSTTATALQTQHQRPKDTPILQAQKTESAFTTSSVAAIKSLAAANNVTITSGGQLKSRANSPNPGKPIGQSTAVTKQTVGSKQATIQATIKRMSTVGAAGGNQAKPNMQSVQQRQSPNLATPTGSLNQLPPETTLTFEKNVQVKKIPQTITVSTPKGVTVVNAKSATTTKGTMNITKTKGVINVANGALNATTTKGVTTTKGSSKVNTTKGAMNVTSKGAMSVGTAKGGGGAGKNVPVTSVGGANPGTSAATIAKNDLANFRLQAQKALNAPIKRTPVQRKKAAANASTSKKSSDDEPEIICID